MITRILQSFVFVVASLVQVTIVDAKEALIPTEDPSGCMQQKSFPCAVSTGDRPRMLKLGVNSWELDRNLVLQGQSQKHWNLYRGMLVLNSHDDQKLHTPFADIFVGKAKIMVHVLEDRVRVMALNGEGVKVKAKGDPTEHFLIPGFQNWYSGVVNGSSESGIASVIDFDEYAKSRAPFFMDHQLGYVKELGQVAGVIKWAARMAADIHRDLVERKMASLEDQHQDRLLRKRKKINFNKYLRRLFLKKIRYDY